MSDNIQYKAIQKLYDKLVNAITPEIDTLLTKAWSKNIIGKEQLDTSLEPTTSSVRKSRALISAIVSRVNLDRAAFGQFLSLLRETQSLEYIADCLESEVDTLRMSSSYSASTGASSNTSSPDQSRYRPPDDLPKLDLAEDVTKESGFNESGREQLGPIVGEEATDKDDMSGSTGTMIHIPKAESSQNYIKAFRKVAGESAQGGVAGVSATNEEDVNLAVEHLREDVSPISEAMDRDGIGEQVLPKHLQTASDKEYDVTEAAVHDILRDNKQKNTEISELKKEVDRLHNEVDSLSKENRELKDKLESKEKETKRTKEEYEQQINDLMHKLREKEEEVERMKVQLADTEKRIDLPKQDLHEKIQQLEKEREELRSSVTKLNDNQRKTEEQNRLQILKLREELNLKQTELIKKQTALNKAQAQENKYYKQVCNLEVQLAQSKEATAIKEAEMERELRESKVREVELKMKILSDKNSQLEQQVLEREKVEQERVREREKVEQERIRERAASEATINDLRLEIAKLRSSSSPAAIDEKQAAEVEHQTSQTESCEGSISSQNPPVDHQSSQTESGQPSRANTADSQQSPSSSGQKVSFEIGHGSDSDASLNLKTTTSNL